MGEFSWLQFLTNAGAPTIVAVAVLYMSYRQYQYHSEERKASLEALGRIQSATLKTIAENAAAMQAMASVMSARNLVFASLEKHLESNIQLTADVRTCLQENVKMAAELKTLLRSINGRGSVGK